MPWQPHRLRDSDVWAEVDAAGELVTDATGRVAVVYKAADGAKVYRAGARNLVKLPGPPLDLVAGDAAPEKKDAKNDAKKAAAAAPGKAPAGATLVWTDGGCSPNPGPGGIGVVVIEGAERREVAEYLGNSTNNICELTAIQRGLELVTDPTRPILVHSDSEYAIGVLSKNWKAKANVQLVADIRALLEQFPDVRFVKVLAHSGIPDNERADALVQDAVRAGDRLRRRPDK